MNWTNKTHDCAVTHCMLLGRPCPAAQNMLNALSASMDRAKGLTKDEFEIAGQTGLSACAKGCMARFVASHQRIRIFCDVSDQADQSGLDRFADAMLCTDASTMLTHVTETPAALAQAIPRPPVEQPATESANAVYAI